jgi:hypothetical protein
VKDIVNFLFEVGHLAKTPSDDWWYGNKDDQWWINRNKEEK